jgi:exonuclease SbcC
MKPLRLEIEGLTSFRTRQEIDFSELGVFVITGPTGSGKTSILDAISFALYGQVPRTGGKGTNQLVSHGETSARILLDFEANGEIYRVVRRLPRKGAQKAMLERRVGANWTPEVADGGVKLVEARIEEIVGLDFGAFKRSVLLPQGDFAEFLNGETKTRREILVRLLDLDRYREAGQLARKRADDLTAGIAAMTRLLEQNFADATEDSLATAASAEKEAAKAANQIEGTRKKIDKLVDTLAEADGSREQLRKLEEELAMTGRVLDTLPSDWRKLEPIDQRTRAASNTAEADVRSAEAAEERTREILAATVHLTGDETSLARLEAAVVGAAADEVALAGLSTQIVAVEDRVRRFETDVVTTKAAVVDAETQHAAARDAEVALRDQLRLHSDRLKLARERADADRRLTAARSEEQLRRAEADVAEQDRRAAEAESAKAASRLDHLHGEHAAAALRAGLAPGQPCPVCHQRVVEIPAGQPDIDNAIAAAKRAADRAASLLKKSVVQAAAAQNAFVVSAALLGEAGARVEQLADAPPLEEAAAVFAEADRRQKDLQAALIAAAGVLKTAQNGHGTAAITLARAQQDWKNCKDQRTAVQARLETTRSSLREAFPGLSIAEAGQTIAKRRDQLSAARDGEMQARQFLAGVQRTLRAAQEARAKCVGEIAAVKNRCAEVRGGLGRLIGDLGGLSAKPAEEESIAGEIDALRSWASGARSTLADSIAAADGERSRHTAALEKALAAAGLPNLETGKVRRAVNKLVEDAKLAARDAETRVASVRQRIEGRRKLEAEVGEARQKAHLYGALADELKAGHFIDYVIAESVRQLAGLASNELREISGGRYSLRADGMDFLVVDHANADETRSVATLSGGETFLASLALATALSQSITDIVGEAVGARLEAMFIDEGFGTLDADTLDVVVDALERLGETRRMIGVITHVPVLAERIPDGLAVEREGSGSRIRPR